MSTRREFLGLFAASVTAAAVPSPTVVNQYLSEKATGTGVDDYRERCGWQGHLYECDDVCCDPEFWRGD